MFTASKMIATSAVLTLTLGAGVAVAAPMQGIPDGDFESGFANNNNEPSKPNAAGAWSWERNPALGTGAVLVTDSTTSSRALRLTVIQGVWNNNDFGDDQKAARTWFTANPNNRTEPDVAWEISADLRTNILREGDGFRQIRLNPIDHTNLPLFQFRFFDQSLSWLTPTGSGTASTTLTNVYASFSIAYDPGSGRTAAYLGDDLIFDQFTTPGLTVGSVVFDNRGVAGPGAQTVNEFFVDNVDANNSAIPEPASLALLGMGAAMMLTRRRRQSV
jgi:hypothetical protein